MNNNKWKNIYTYIIKWSTMKIIFDGFIGKIFLILSILSVLLTIPFIRNNDSTSIFFMSISILLFILGYIVFIITIPEIINKYTKYDYVESLLNREKDGTLNKMTEYKILQDKDIEYLPIYYDEIDNFKIVKQIDKFIKDTSSDSIYQLSSIKYSFVDNDNIFIRIILSIILILFLLSFYYLSIDRLIIYIMGEI